MKVRMFLTPLKMLVENDMAALIKRRRG